MSALNSLEILVCGATGRMGQMVRRVVAADAECHVHSLLVYAGHAEAGKVQQPENLPLHECFDAASTGGTDAAVAIDFSLPEGCVHHVQQAAEVGIPIVIGTTGLVAEQHESLKIAAKKIPVFWAPNMSIGIALLRRFITQAAESLPAGEFDIEIVERHHRNKIDSPSGTAIALGQAAALGRGINHDEHAVYNRPRQGTVRDVDAIGYAAVRGGSVVGDHDVLFMGQYEQIHIGHHAVQREVFAAGALRAAKWLVQQPAGLYGMDELLR